MVGRERRIAAIRQPADQSAAVSSFDLSPSGKHGFFGSDVEGSAEANLRGAGRAELQAFDLPGIGVSLELAAQTLKSRPGQDGIVNTDSEPDRKRQPVGSG